MPVKLFILGDVRLHCDGLALQLARVPSVLVIGFGALREALRTLGACQVDVALIDTLWLDVPKTVEALRRSASGLKIVAIGVREAEVLACATAGVDGCVDVEAGIDDLMKVVESVVRNELMCSPKVAAVLYRSIATAGAAETGAMTHRELQVVELLEGGLSNKEIAGSLGIEPSTVKNHVQNILQKLGVHRRGQAIAKLRRWPARPFLPPSAA